MDTDSRSGVKAVRPWSRPGERYVGYRWPQGDGSRSGQTASYRADADGAGVDGARWDELRLIERPEEVAALMRAHVATVQ